MPKSGKEADIVFRNTTLARSRGNHGELAESDINVYANDP
jgi:hypothetical protein